MSEPDFKIGDEEFSFPEGFRMGDPILIEELTGLNFDEFGTRFDATREPGASQDMKVFVGLVGVAVWQAHPAWKRDQVAAFVEQVDFEAFSSVGELRPPAETETDNKVSRSPGTSESSTITPAPYVEPEPAPV